MSVGYATGEQVIRGSDGRTATLPEKLVYICSQVRTVRRAVVAAGRDSALTARVDVVNVGDAEFAF